MKLPLEWLHEYVRPDLGARELAARLDMTGTEVKRVETHGVGAPEHFVVGRVLSAEQHPDADRLRVCTVDVGEAQPSQIVCGAPNVAAGQTVAVARPGAVMPGGQRLGVAKLRGVESHGMICAEDELGIGSDHAGIMVLDTEVAPGSPLSDVLPVATEVLELEITPNRPDCLGVYGVAREVHAATGATLVPPPWNEDGGSAEPAIPGVSVTVQDTELCPRFTVRLFEDVRIGPSPPWLKARLAAAGQRPISNVVDITNYVMLLTGQPLHAFDADKVAGGHLIVRRAQPGETLVTLDGQERKLDAEMVLVCDEDGPSGIAGVMGGQRSEVSEATSRVLLEVATWNGPNINRTMARLGLRSEAGARFEKSLAPEMTIWAQAVATRLMIDLCGARVVGGTVDAGGPGPAPQVLRVRDARVKSLLGVAVDRERAAAVLRGLGFGVDDADDGLDVAVPSFRRNDVYREADVIEEIARLVVLDDLPATIPENRTGRAARLSVHQRLRRRAVDALVGRGAHEIAGWSFTTPELADRLELPERHPRRRFVELENPMSEDHRVLRTTLLGSLLDAAQRNGARGFADVTLLETGSVYFARTGTGPDGRRALPREAHALGLLTTGDVFAAKGLLEAMCAAVRVELTVEGGSEPFLHPGRAGRVLAGPAVTGMDGVVTREHVGWLGEVHPRVAARWDLGQVAGFSLDLDRLLAHASAVPFYEDLTSFPELRQDLSVVLSDDVPAARLVECVLAAGGDMLARAEVFDVYTGEQIGAGRRSLTLHLAFRAPDRTLSDEDVEPVRGAIVAAVASELGGELRGG